MVLVVVAMVEMDDVVVMVGVVELLTVMVKVTEEVILAVQ